MIFREMVHEDLDRVLELESLCFKEPWSKSNCLYELDENVFSHGWVLVDQDLIVGYAFLWETFEMAQLARIGVDVNLRRRGFGDQLMVNLIQRAQVAECEFMTLDVRMHNEAALGLYLKHDFIQVNVSKGYYSDGEDAIVMTRAL